MPNGYIFLADSSLDLLLSSVAFVLWEVRPMFATNRFAVASFVLAAASLRIPRQSGRGFRFDVGHRSDLIPATIPK